MGFSIINHPFFHFWGTPMTLESSKSLRPKLASRWTKSCWSLCTQPAGSWNPRFSTRDLDVLKMMFSIYAPCVISYYYYYYYSYIYMCVCIMYTHPRTIITCMLEGSSFGFTEDGVIILVFQLDSAYYGKSLRSREGLDFKHIWYYIIFDDHTIWRV